MSNSRFDHHTPKYEDSIGNFNLSYHLEMLKDTERVESIKKALDETLIKGGVHCDLGAGTGIFAIYAAQKCQKVYAIEYDREVFKIAQKNINNSPFKDKIELLFIDAMDFKPKEKVDTLLVEMMSIWCINEPQISVMNHAIQHILKKEGHPIPNKIINLVELGNYDFYFNGIECRASIPQFTGISKPRIMTTSHIFNQFDLTQINSEHLQKEIQIPSLLDGVINCARLTSLVQLSPSITYYASDSLMPQTIVPLNDLRVKSGDQLIFQADFKVRTSIDASRFKIRIAEH